jgi:hypothetical protein
MATITDAEVRVLDTGRVIRSDCFGNNAAVECPNCNCFAVLLIARPNQRGSSARNPGICRNCGCRINIVDDVDSGALDVVNLVSVAGARP